MKFSVALPALTLSAAVIFAACSAVASRDQVNNQAPPTNHVAQTQKAAPAVEQDDAKRITIADAKAAFDARSAVFIDTRDFDSFNSGHIKGAINMRAAEVEARLKELPKDKQIIAYCSWPSEHTSARAVQILNENGVTNAAALVGGTAAWQKAGYPMEKGETK